MAKILTITFCMYVAAEVVASVITLIIIGVLLWLWGIYEFMEILKHGLNMM